MYRLVKETNNIHNTIDYIIQKKINFLFFSFWTTYYEYQDLKDALVMLEILRNKKSYITREIIA